MSRRRKLLLADDSPTVQKVISLTFADEGLDVVTASDGREALRLLEDGPPPDIILADAVMPGPDGYELCERVRRDERLRHVPVVLLVGTFEPFNEAEARRVGADTVLTKPFQSIRDLVSKVGSLLGGESKPEHEERGPESHAAEGHRELAEEVQTRAPAATPESANDISEARADAAARGADDAGQPAAHDWAAREAHAHADPAASFADLGADDELIEARPADPFPAAPFTGAGAFDAAASREPARESFSFAGAEEGARPAFAAQAAGAAAADEALLDLGQLEPPAAQAAAEADEFILDLDDEFDARAASAPSFEDLDEAPADAAGAFAEAAHGASDVEEAARTPFEFSALPAETEAARDPEMAREVVGPHVPPFVGGAKDFIEPQVVPAEEPTPGTFESAFTDGSVEGDVPRPAPFIPETPAPPQPAFPEPPSAAGYTMGEARSGVDEGVRPAQLSPETIDAIARRVVELISDRVVREVAWEVVPDLAELIIRRRLEEERSK